MQIMQKGVSPAHQLKTVKAGRTGEKGRKKQAQGNLAARPKFAEIYGQLLTAQTAGGGHGSKPVGGKMIHKPASGSKQGSPQTRSPGLPAGEMPAVKGGTAAGRLRTGETGWGRSGPVNSSPAGWTAPIPAENSHRPGQTDNTKLNTVVRPDGRETFRTGKPARTVGPGAMAGDAASAFRSSFAGSAKGPVIAGSARSGAAPAPDQTGTAVNLGLKMAGNLRFARDAKVIRSARLANNDGAGAELAPNKAGPAEKSSGPADSRLNQPALAADAAIKRAGGQLKLTGPADKKGSSRKGAEFSRDPAVAAGARDKPVSGKPIYPEMAAAQAMNRAGRPAGSAGGQQAGSRNRPAALENQVPAEGFKLMNTKAKEGQVRDVQVNPGEIGQLPGGVKPGPPAVKTAGTQGMLASSTLDIIVSSIAGQVKNGISALQVRLKPESLGQIELQLQMNDGLVSIRIIARSVETLALINSNLPYIQESLERQGVRLDNMIAGPGDQEKQGKQETGSGYREENRTPVFRESSEYHDGSAGREQSYLQPGILNILA